MADNVPIEPPKSNKDSWEKADIILRPVGALITALTIAFVSFLATGYLNKSQERDSRIKLYAELMSSRENSESALRKDMFTSILESILKGNAGSLDDKILQLELLTYNFHESLNLMPLFEYLNRMNNCLTDKDNLSDKLENKKRLIKMAKAVNVKQMSSLEEVSKMAEFAWRPDSSELICDPISLEFEPTFAQAIYKEIDTLTGRQIKRPFREFEDSVLFKDNKWHKIKHSVRLQVLDFDTWDNNVKVNLKIDTYIDTNLTKPVFSISPDFTINYFEFPLINNTRLIHDMRLAVVMTSNNFDLLPVTFNQHRDKCVSPKSEPRVDFKVLFFPGSHSSLKEKPFFDDIVSNLLPEK